jgi:hypothetical protein
MACSRAAMCSVSSVTEKVRRSPWSFRVVGNGFLWRPAFMSSPLSFWRALSRLLERWLVGYRRDGRPSAEATRRGGASSRAAGLAALGVLVASGRADAGWKEMHFLPASRSARMMPATLAAPCADHAASGSANAAPAVSGCFIQRQHMRGLDTWSPHVPSNPNDASSLSTCSALRVATLVVRVWL